jgi:hypothetical protein
LGIFGQKSKANLNSQSANNYIRCPPNSKVIASWPPGNRAMIQFIGNKIPLFGRPKKLAFSPPPLSFDKLRMVSLVEPFSKKGKSSLSQREGRRDFIWHGFTIWGMTIPQAGGFTRWGN